MRIEFPRGDSYERGFLLKDKATNTVITDTFSEVYFTVKKMYSSDEYSFQKKMTTGGIVNDGDGHYTLYVAPEDTENLPFGEYDCDMEFVKTGYKKTFVGKLILGKEVTHSSNE